MPVSIDGSDFVSAEVTHIPKNSCGMVFGDVPSLDAVLASVDEVERRVNE